VVHQLKGAGGGYGFPEITEAAATAEKCVKAQEVTEAIAAEVNSLIRLIRSVEGYVPSREKSRGAECVSH